MRLRWLLGVALALCVGSGIYYIDLLKAAVSPNPIPSSPQSIDRARALWKLNCEACHGVEGRGDGPVSASLRKRPKDLTRIAMPPAFPDGVVAYRIANGDDVMPAWKSVLSPEEIWDLVNYIRAQRRP